MIAALRHPRLVSRLGRLLVAATGGLLLAAVTGWALAWWVPLPERLTERGSVVVLYADDSVAHTTLSSDDKWRIDVHLDEVDPRYVEALIQLEDERYRFHPGVDPIAIVRALWTDLRAGEIVSGASTLSMQLARLAEPRPRTLRSKLIEMARAVQFEIRMSKDEILEAYLNFVPYGRNVEGLEAASLAYFGHRPHLLSPNEMAILLAVPQDPTHRHPHPDNHAALKAARAKVAQRLVDRGVLDRGQGEGSLTDAEVLDQIDRAPLPPRLQPLPREIPHASAWLGKRRASSQRIETHLDRGLQSLASRTLRKIQSDANHKGIYNGSVVIVDHKSGQIEALVGNFDFFDEQNGGQIIGFDTPRSPGSTLKPFVYGMAIDRGLALPEHLVPDVPVRYGSYTPDNYDGTFAGMVELEEALARSLNIPFIQLLDELGVERFLGTLREAGVGQIDPRPGHYGLSLVAGGIELTPIEIAGLYAMLANEGRAVDLTVERSHRPLTQRPILTPGTAFLVRRALSMRDRPDFPARSQLSAVPRDIHWKTGTSYGHRDAWAVGSGPSHTVAVWLGNFSNHPSSHLVGAQAAGPVLFDLLEALGAEADFVDARPAALRAVDVCALSGRLPVAHCPHQKKALAPESKVPTERCDLHQRIEIDLATGLRVTPSCRAGRETSTRTAVLWPPDVRRWLDQPTDPIPSLAPECRTDTQQHAPRIVTPAAGAVALLVPGMAPAHQEVALQASADGTRLAWFVNGAYLGRAGSDEVVWWTPRAGRHTVVVQDDAGRTDRVIFDVRASL